MSPARRTPAPRIGRPPVGTPTTLRLPPDLRARLDKARPRGESLADQIRRLLTVAIDPELPGLLEAAASRLVEIGQVAHARVAGELAASVTEGTRSRRGGAS